MKRLTSILFLSLFLLNILGYYGFLIGLKVINGEEFRTRLDHDDYLIEQTITLKIPLALPYSSGQEEFNRVDGEFQFDGKFYRLVKQKHLHDTLHVVCIKDNRSMEIHQALTDYVKSFTDAPADNPLPGVKVPGFIKDYISCSIQLMVHHEGWIKTFSYSEVEGSPLVVFRNSINHPPEEV